MRKNVYAQQVFKTGAGRSDKSQKVVDNVLKYFPDFDAFPLCPPSADPEVIQDLPDAWGQGTIDSSFVEGVEKFKRLMKPKLCPKKSFVGPGLVTGEGLLARTLSLSLHRLLFLLLPIKETCNHPAKVWEGAGGGLYMKESYPNMKSYPAITIFTAPSVL